MSRKTGKIIRWVNQIYQENQEEIQGYTIRMQRYFALSIAILFTVYTVFMLLNDWIYWGECYPQTLYGLLPGGLGALHWLILSSKLNQRQKIYMVHLFLFLLLQIIAFIRCFADGWVSYSLTICTMVATAVISLNPVQYTILCGCAILAEILFSVLRNNMISFAFLYDIVDSAVVYFVAVGIHYLVTILRYQLFEEKQQLKKESILDGLTGLYTRKYFEKYFQLHYREDELSAMIHLDLDNFKKLNDTLGHGQGDAILIRVADLLRAHIRKTDCVSRVGGDEFMIFMGSLATPENATQRIQEILDEFPIPIREGEIEIPISVSIGMVFSKAGEEYSYTAMYERADEEMYKAKKGGKGRAAIFAPDGEEMWLLSKKLG